jgi:hypothetical protein
MNTEDELAMWAKIYFELHQIPDELRLKSHIVFIKEVEHRISMLEAKLYHYE